MTVFVSTPYEKDNGDFNDLPDHVWPRCAKREEDVRIHNVNLLLHALNLDAAQITL